MGDGYSDLISSPYLLSVLAVVSVESTDTASNAEKSMTQRQKQREKELSDQAVESQFITVLAINGEIPQESAGESGAFCGEICYTDIQTVRGH